MVQQELSAAATTTTSNHDDPQRFRRWLQAARGEDEEEASSPSAPNQKDAAGKGLLPCFALRRHHLGSLWRRPNCGSSSDGRTSRLPTPQDFHSTICESIRRAEHRVILACLYMGPSSGPQELELLNAVEDAAATKGVTVHILMDESRATRPIQVGTTTTTTCAQAVYQRLQQGWKRRQRRSTKQRDERVEKNGDKRKDNDEDSVGLFLFNVLKEPYKSLLPSPWNEVAGVFHIKAYIMDESLILGGANLSEEYFTNRQDRYMHVKNGGGGLVDFYAHFVSVLQQYAQPYRPPPASWTTRLFFQNNNERERRQLQTSLEALFREDTVEEKNNNNDDSDIVAWVVPTFQAPFGFFSKSWAVPSDVMATQSLLESIAREASPRNKGLYVASPYLNPTRDTLSFWQRHFSRLVLLSAAYPSHTFAPKPGVPLGWERQWVPWAFLEIARQVAAQMEKDHHGQQQQQEVWLYNRAGWTFHSKGLWVTMEEEEEEDNNMKGNDRDAMISPCHLIAATVTSGNYGGRSECLDMESSCLVLFPPGSTPLQHIVAREWNDTCLHATPFSKDNHNNNNKEASLALRWASWCMSKIVKRFL